MTLLALALGLFVVALHRWQTPLAVSLDGGFYLDAGRGLDVPAPYDRRWLLPQLLGARRDAWAWVTGLSIAAGAPLVCAYAGGGTRGLVAAVLYVGLPGLVAFPAAHPVLVDAPAFALALGGALAWRAGCHELGMVLAVMAGFCKESAPVFAAVFAWSPTLLLALLIVRAARRWKAAPAVLAQHRLEHDYLEAARYLYPWGALVVLFPLALGWDRATLQALTALAVGYGQLLIASDRSRLYQWAAPCVIALAVARMPPWAPALLALHLWHPWRSP